MKEDIIKVIGDSLTPLNMHIDDVIYKKEGKQRTLEIVLDSEDNIDIDMIVKATNIINPILDEADLIKEKYILDVYGKSKGDD